LENVFDRLEMAVLYEYELKSLYSACCQFIRRNLKMVKTDAKWQELKEEVPKWAFSILHDF
jgi:hypothetical protein